MTNQINEMFDASLVGNDVIDSIYSTSSQTLNDAMISSYDRVITFGIGKIVEGFKHSTVPHNDELHVFSKESVFCDKPNHCETNGISHPLSFQEAADRDANYQSTFYVSISHTIFSRIDPTTPDKLQYWINQEHQEDKIASRAKRIRTANNETLNWLLGTSNTEKEIDNDEPSKLYTKQFRTDDPSYQKKLQHCFDRCRMSDKDRIKFPFLVKSSVYPKILTFHLPIMSGSVACLGLSEETAASGFLCLSGKTRPMMRFPSSRFGANILSEKDKGVQCRSPHPIDKLRVSSSNITVTSVHEAEYSRSYLTTEIAYSKAKHSFLNVFRAFGIQDNQKIKEMIRFIAYHFFRQNKPIPWNYMEEILEWTFKFHERIDEVDRVESQESAWIYFGCLSESKEIKTEETDFEKAPEIHLTAEQVEQKANATLASSMKKQAKIKQKQERNLRYKQQNLTAAVQESPMEQQIRFGRYFTNKEILPHYGSDQRKDHLVWKSKAWHIARMAVHWMLYLLRDKMVRLPPHMTPYISPDSIDDIANKRIKLAWDPIINGTMKGTLKLVFGTCDQNANTGLNNGENLNMYNVFDVSDSKLDSDKAIMNSFNTGIFKPKTHLTFGGGGGGNDISQQAQQQQAQGNTGNNKLIKDKTGVTQTQNNNNPNSIWSQQQRIQGAVQQVGSGNSAVREIRDDLGVVDIIETPDNKACGVVKPHALYSRLSVDAMPTNKLVEVIHRKCRIYSLDEIFEDIESYYHGNENGDNRMIHVWLNGKCLGLCSAEDAEKLSKYMKKNRYLLMGEAFLSVVNDREQLSLELLTDAGRLVRPLFKAEYVPGLFQMIDNEPLYKKSTFNQLLRSGHVQYLDKAEENAEALIATDIDVLMKLFVKLGPEEYSKLPFTHAEIKSELMLGICSSQVIFAGHNQGPRNTFATAMIKQSIPAYTESRLEQMDGNFQLMHHVTTPLITVDTLDWLRAHDLTASGEMVMMANLCWLEKNIEDSLVLNAETIEKGTFRALQHSTITVVERKIGTGITQTELFTRPELENTLNIKTASYEFIDEDGLPFIGSKLTANHVSVGKVTPLDQPVDQYRFQDVSNLLPTKQSGYVTEVLVTSNLQGQKMTKLLLTKIAQASSGDKFSSRSAQKTTANIVSARDLPFNDQGLIPDLIINPHAYPSRMTVAQFLEMLGGWVSIKMGKRIYGSAFTTAEQFAKRNWKELQQLGYADGNPTLAEMKDEYGEENLMDVFNKILENHGLYKQHMKCHWYNGMTGRRLGDQGHSGRGDGTVFYAPIYEMRLIHAAHSKLQKRARFGPRHVLTRQPQVGGMSKSVAYKLGQMEMVCIQAHGGAYLSQNYLMLSDLHLSHSCLRCGMLIKSDLKNQLFFCRNCNSSEHCVKIPLSYNFKLLVDKLLSSGIVARYQLKKL